jgi:hypothetical protein
VVRAHDALKLRKRKRGSQIRRIQPPSTRDRSGAIFLHPVVF